jgi:hypothetical protein
MTFRYAAHISSYRSAPDMKEFTLLIARVTLGDPCILLQVAHFRRSALHRPLTLLQADSSLSSPPQPQRGGFFSKRDEGPAMYHSTVGESKAYNKDASNLYRLSLRRSIRPILLC